MTTTHPQETKAITLTIDGQTITVPEGTTIWDAARKLGIDIPVLCHDPRLVPVAVCRVCAVEVKGARVAQAARRTPACRSPNSVCQAPKERRLRAGTAWRTLRIVESSLLPQERGTAG